ncbi:restriction endonuclease subunit S [Nakamurella antarctica]|uniref:Restriction endonuclease subunit S n=1 Tax=Nakamurella antarctica TaxID=1902245 RepID=A0A3G8ZNR3_9ACTN|nr:restriction endonuclease subunit S [Nakamurella antarctica]AZI58890.1 restriction endonuclease subunit S [Nakamurella antarctica]
MSNSQVTGWSTHPLSELIDRKFTGPSPTCEERQIAAAEEWGLLKTTAVTWSGWNENAHKVPPRLYWGKEALEVHQGDVLITKAGPRHRVGVVVLVAATRPHLMVSGKMVGLRPKTAMVVPKVLAGLLSTDAAQDYLNSRTTGMAESQTNFADEALLRIEVDVPPLSEQRRIAKILDTLDDQIHATRQIIAKLELIRRGMLDRMFLQSTDERPEHDLSEFLVKIDAGWSPECYERAPAAGAWGVLKVSAVSTGKYRQEESKTLPPGLPARPALEVKDGDVLCVRANGVGDLVGRVAFVESTRSGLMLSDKTLRLVPKSSVNGFYLSLLLSSPPLRRQIESLMGGSSSQKNISQAQIRRLSVAIPELSEQNRAASMVKAVDSRLNAEIEAARKQEQSKLGLMSDLLTGRVRVPLETAL